MPPAALGTKLEPLAILGFRGEKKITIRRQTCAKRTKQASQIAQINQRIGGQDQIVTPGGQGFDIAHDQVIINAPQARFCDHGGRKIDASPAARPCPETSPRQARAAAQIENGQPLFFLRLSPTLPGITRSARSRRICGAA